MNKYLKKKIVLFFILLVMTLIFSSCSGRKVQTVSEETEANQIIDILREHGIIADKIESGEAEKKVFEIHVKGGEAEFGTAIQLMEDHCLPQPLPPKIETSGLVSSIEVEKAQELRRTKINLETQLRKLPGTTCVDITIVPPENKSLSLNPYKASASVVLKHKTENFGLTVDQIARMVAGGVQGLTADNVHVTLTRQPLRPLPDLNSGQNFRRIMYVSVIGLTTILLFIGFVVFLRRRKSESNNESDFDELVGEEIDQIESDEDGDNLQMLDEAIDSENVSDNKSDK